MQEYCHHCAQKLGVANNFVGITPHGRLARVECSGCGLTQVNHLGECQKCQLQHKRSNRFFVMAVCMITFGFSALIYYSSTPVLL